MNAPTTEGEGEGAVTPRLGGRLWSLPVGSHRGRAVVLALVISIGLAAFLSIRPTPVWLIALLVVLVALGTDGIVRSHPQYSSAAVADTAAYLFLPASYTLAAGLLLEEVVTGYWTLAAAAGAGVLLLIVVDSQYASVDRDAAGYATRRLLLNSVTYLTAYVLFALTYAFDLNLPLSMLAVGVVSLLMSVETLREGEAIGGRALLYPAAVALALAELRWALHYAPLSGLAASLVLLLGLYLATGLLLHHLRDQFSRAVALEFALVGLVVTALVLATSAFS